MTGGGSHASNVTGPLTPEQVQAANSGGSASTGPMTGAQWLQGISRPNLGAPQGVPFQDPNIVRLRAMLGLSGNPTTGTTPTPPVPAAPQFGGGPQTPTVNLNNVAPGGSMQTPAPVTPSTGGPMPAYPGSPNANPLAALQSPQGVHPSGQPDGMSFTQAYAPTNQHMQVMNFLQSLMGNRGQ